eukprot:jgi/Botrbrau1/23421/Bobra.0051s0064.1
MGSPQIKRARVAVNDPSECCSSQNNLDITRDDIFSSSILDSQHRLWVEREKYKHLWDVVVQTDGGQEILCSKKDLFTFSEYFGCTFSNDSYREAKSHTLVLHETDGDDFEVLVSLHYSKDMASLTSSNLLGVYELAEKFQFHAASKLRQKVISGMLDPSSVVKILTLKHRLGVYGADDAEPFRKYAATSESLMTDVESLLQLPLDVLADILSRDDICLESERQVLEVIEAWCLQTSPDVGKSCGESAVNIPDQLWKCLRLNVADEELLRDLLSNRIPCLTASQLSEVGIAAVNLSQLRRDHQLIPSSRSTFTFSCNLPGAFLAGKADSESFQATMFYGIHNWDIDVRRCTDPIMEDCYF